MIAEPQPVQSQPLNGEQGDKRELLTVAEHEAMDLSARLVGVVCRGVIADGHTREQDVNEFCLHIHAIQNMILAQAAARAYPDRYRLMGGSVS